MSDRAKPVTTSSDVSVPHEVRCAYEQIHQSLVITQRSDRGWLEVTGKDRLTWLHNLTTNAIKTLPPGEGNYAFALNVQGRILFDLNALVMHDAIGIDLDARWMPLALKHFNKYIITEDVTVIDRSGEFGRVALVGIRSHEHFAKLAGSPAAMIPLLGHLEFTLKEVPPVRAFRSDYAGLPAFEFVVPRTMQAELVHHLSQGLSEFPDGARIEEALRIARIEQAIPWPGFEITDEYLPAETRQLARAVSFQKGCYLGQEVVERMRSRQVVARQLVLVKIQEAVAPSPGADISAADGKSVGRVTSACHSIVHGCPIALGYVKTASSAPGTPLQVASAGDRTMPAMTLPMPAHVH